MGVRGVQRWATGETICSGCGNGWAADVVGGGGGGAIMGKTKKIKYRPLNHCEMHA